jgi:hypothetical protein
MILTILFNFKKQFLTSKYQYVTFKFRSKWCSQMTLKIDPQRKRFWSTIGLLTFSSRHAQYLHYMSSKKTRYSSTRRRYSFRASISDWHFSFDKIFPSPNKKNRCIHFFLLLCPPLIYLPLLLNFYIIYLRPKIDMKKCYFLFCRIYVFLFPWSCAWCR